MSTTRALAWNTAVQVAGKVVSTAVGVVIVGIMTRYLGQEGFGMYSTANAYFQVFGILLDFGLSVMLVQMLGEHAGEKAYEDRAVSAAFTLRTLLGGVILTAGAFIGLLMPYPPILKVALFAIWGSFFFSALNQIVIGVHQRHLKMHVVAISEVVGRLVLLLGILVATTAGWGLVPIVLIVSLGGFVNFVINAAIARRYAAVRWNWDPAFWRALLRRSWPVGVSILFNLIYFKADALILSLARPLTEAGVYGAAYRVLEILISLPFMYTGVLLPLIANAWSARDLPRFHGLFRNSLVAMTVLVAPMVAGTLVLGREVMVAIAGRDFAVSGDVLKILMVAAGVIFFGTVSSHAIIALDAQRKMLPIYIAVALVTLAGYLIFIPQYGMWAAAWLTVFSEVCVALASTIISARRSGTRLSALPHLKAIAAATIMALAVIPLKSFWLPIPILLGAAMYVALVIAFGAVPRETLRELLTSRRAVAATSLASDVAPPADLP